MRQERKPLRAGHVYLDRYCGIELQLKALTRRLEALRDRSEMKAVRAKPIYVHGGTSAYDAMAEDVAAIVDEERQLRDDIEAKSAALREIRKAIEAVPSTFWRKDVDGALRQIDGEMVKAVLTIRYIECVRDWDNVAVKVGYSRSQTLRLNMYGIEKVEELMGLTEENGTKRNEMK